MDVRLAYTPRGRIAALFSLTGLLASCTNLDHSSVAAAPAQASARHPVQLEVTDNFSVPDLETRFEEVARNVAPTVVAISATDAPLDVDDALRADQINTQKLAAMMEPVDRTVGTGFIVDSDGYIVTNDHVVSSTDYIWVTTDDHHVYPAIVVGSDPRSDLAVLKIPAHNLPAARFADNPAKRGQWTLALGNPYGLAAGGDMALSVGVVSATNRSLPKLSNKEDRLYSDLIQTTAQINPGNSGGPLFDSAGDVIGINAAVILPQKLTNGIGFAIPVTARVRQVIADLKQGHEVVYGWLGVRVVSPTPLERKQAGINQDLGAKVDAIDAGSPASKSELRIGDIIERFNGQAISDGDQFVRVVGESPVDSKMQAVVHRGGKSLTLDVLTSRRAGPVAVTRQSQRIHWRGMLLGPIPENWDFGATPRPAGGLMVIAVDAHSPVLREGFGQGSIITAVAGKPVRDVPELQRILNESSPRDCTIDWARTSGQVVSAQE